MMRQGTLCWMLILAPIMAAADDEGPTSALDATANDSESRVVALTDINLAANDAGSTATLEADGTLTLELAVATEEGYWIGLDCESPSEALRSQLSLAKDNGLVIAAVIDDSPAKSAGLLANDVVTVAKLGDKVHPISSVDQFSDLIQAAKESPIELTVVREGKPTPVTVTPAARQEMTLAKGDVKGNRPGPHGRGPGIVFRFGGPAAKKPDGVKGGPGGQHARRGGDRHQREPGEARRQAGHRHGRHMAHHGRGGQDRHAQHGRGGHDRHAQHGRGWNARGHHPRQLTGRGPGRHFGRLAMLRHGRHGGFGHHGFGRGGFGHRGFGHGGFAQRGRGGFGHGGFGRGRFGNRGFALGSFGHGGFGHRRIGFGGFGRGGFGRGGDGHHGFGRGRSSHRGFGRGGFGNVGRLGNHFALSRGDNWSRGGRSDGGSRIAMFLNLLREHHGSRASARPSPSQQRSTSGIESRLEALLTRLEKAAGPQAQGQRPEPERGPGRGFGFGGFRPEFGNRDPDPARGAGRPAGDNNRERGPGRPDERREPPRRETSGEGPSLDQMRGQLRRLAEQQENMMKAIRDLSEALEKSSRK